MDLYRVNPDKVFVVPNGRDARFVRKSETEISFAKEKFGIMGDFIFFYGQIFNRRNVDKLILAFEKIAQEFPGLQLLVVGRNKTQKPFIPIDEIAQQVNNRLGRSGVIRREFIESNEDLIALCSGAVVGAYLSTYEGFGLPPLEFLACGTPVLAPDLTALKDTLERKQVVIEDPSDVNEIALAIKRVLTDPSVRERAQVEGPIQAEKFLWSDCAKTTLAILKQAIQ